MGIWVSPTGRAATTWLHSGWTFRVSSFSLSLRFFFPFGVCVGVCVCVVWRGEGGREEGYIEKDVCVHFLYLKSDLYEHDMQLTFLLFYSIILFDHLDK